MRKSEDRNDKFKKPPKKARVFVSVEDAITEANRAISARNKITGEGDCILLRTEDNEILVGKTIKFMAKRTNNSSVFQPYETIQEEIHCVVYCLTVMADKMKDSRLRRHLKSMQGVKFFPIYKLTDIESAIRQ